MAPVTRSSVHGRSVQASAQHNQRFDGSNDMLDDDTRSSDDENPFTEEPDSVSSLRSAQAMLLPLQETADRVSRQVEEFAKALDKFKADRDPTDLVLWDDAAALLRKYNMITESRAERTAAKSQASSADTDRQVQNLRLEANMWLLAENLVICKNPRSVSEAQEHQRSDLQKLHRYSRPDELWNSFLESDTIAQEYEAILDWLQESAFQASAPLEDVVKDLVAKSERGDGIWSAGLIYTKDAIKKQKRSRAWPMPLDPTNPGLRSTHLREEDDQVLVTQMDPDAPTREEASLAKADEYHEEAAWRLCWEMLRRGIPLADFEQFWGDRKETWRTALLTGGIQRSESSNSPWLRIANIMSNPEWLVRCRSMSDKDSSGSQYEEAVYGVLSGNHAAALSICDSLDDVLFSYFNAVLIERFSDYVAAYRRKLQNSQMITYTPALSSFPAIREFLSAAEVNDQAKEEFQQPLKFIEAAVMGQSFEQFFIQQGHAAAQVAHVTGQAAHLMEKDESQFKNEHAQVAAQDQDAVRMIAHLQLIMHGIGFLDDAYKENQYQMDNNIVNYIGFLERDRKFNLLPLYASKLSPTRTQHVLGTILIKVTNNTERELLIKLLKLYQIDYPLVIFGIFSLANYHELDRLKKTRDNTQATEVTHYVEANNIKLVKIKTDFMGSELTASEQKSIESAEWMRYMDVKNWGTAVWCVCALYKVFLLGGQLSAARELLSKVGLARCSMAATGMNLNLANSMEEESVNGDTDMENSADSIGDRIQPVSPTKRRISKRDSSVHLLAKQATNREELAAQSRVWAQFEQLVDALWALERWQSFADEIEGIRGELGNMRTAKRELKQALEEVQSAMTYILDPDFLNVPTDEAEGKVLELIRYHYVPEVILGYNSALYFAGHALTRSYLIECMNLAQEVAQNPTLTEAFVKAGRMRELVMAFALDSQALLRANEAGPAQSKTKKAKRDSFALEGKGDIWQVSWKEQKKTDSELAV